MENNDEINFEKLNNFFQNKEIKNVDVDAIDLKQQQGRSRLSELKQQMESESVPEVIPSDNQVVTNSDKSLTLSHELSSNQLEFIQLLIPFKFVITDICNEIGISRTTFYRWLEDDEHFKTSYDDTYNYFIDVSHKVILESLHNGDVKTAMFILNKLDKRYKDKIDITSNGNTMGSIINIIAPNG